jgi:hypothetical protein
MKTRNVVTVAFALAAPLSVAWAAKPVDPESLPKISCSEIHFGAAFLKKWPMAPQACIEGRDNNGTRYAKFTAKVYLTGEDRTTVTLVDAQGKDVTTASIKPKPGSAVMIGGRKIQFKDLKKGEEITFWVSEKRTSATSLPAPTSDQWALAPPLPNQ